jgi:hypothetical protein
MEAYRRLAFVGREGGRRTSLWGKEGEEGDVPLGLVKAEAVCPLLQESLDCLE